MIALSSECRQIAGQCRNWQVLGHMRSHVTFDPWSLGVVTVTCSGPPGKSTVPSVCWSNVRSFAVPANWDCPGKMNIKWLLLLSLLLLVMMMMMMMMMIVIITIAIETAGKRLLS